MRVRDTDSADLSGAHASRGRAAHLVAGLSLDYLAPESAVRQVLRAAAAGPGYCCVSNAHQCIEAHRDPQFREAVNAAALRISDSKILDLARRFLHGVPALPTLKGADFLLELARAAAADGRRIGFFGGSPATLDMLVRRVQAEIPGCEIGYAFAPPFGGFSELADPAFVAAVNQSGVDLLFVGLGCPKQEWWMHRNAGVVKPFMIGVGAAFDFVAGAKQASPAWVHRAGLEWLYRLVQEPRRLWKRYLVFGPAFIGLLVKQKFARQ